ncbi:TonB-dependent receptor [Pseudoalteromonas sp. B131b]|uniref:TonB-dependent receptor n=1 Tax=unclassified Pseudoalteromonas TaxID=194690 RepID=UPI000BBE839B|nr:TonB-dependent receptor [Pseudoalteromonas sp. 1_2015MBL_MicDiv]ATG77523.1 TonB-dependent receptor [Pseudoalteromonas sp. 1_2015MBL_MicDiv]
MTIINKAFKLSAITAAVLATQLVYAKQDKSTQEKTKVEADIEIIEVSGLAASLKKSINDKRFAENVVDSINAEDIGKSTDQNIADALSRVTGVSVQTVDGEGARVTVRGANSQQNNISMNGVQLGSTGYSQGVDLSQYSSDILSKIEVVKTPSADHEEGALGANINLSTTKPLDLNYEINTVTLEGRYNDLSEEDNYKVSGTFSRKFFDDTFGVVVTAVKETNTYRKDQFSATEWYALESPLATDTNGNIVENVVGIAPRNVQYQYHESENDRTNFNIGLQWIASENTEFNFNAILGKQDINNSMHGINTRSSQYGNLIEGVDPGLGGTGPALFTDPEASWRTIDLETNTFTKFVNRFSNGGLVQSEGDFENKNQILSLDMNHSFTDSFAMKAGVGYSKTQQIPNNSVYVALQNFGNINAWIINNVPPEDIEPVGYDCTSSSVCTLVAGQGLIDYGPNDNFGDPLNVWDNYSTTGFNPDELRAQHLSYMSRSLNEVEDTQKSLFVDFDYALNFDNFRSIEFGAKWSNRTKYVDAQIGTFSSVGEGVVVTNPYTGNPAVLGSGLRDISGDLITDGEEFPVDDFMAGLGYARDSITDGWNRFSAFKAFEVAQGSTEVAFNTDDSNTRNTELDNLAFYTKLNFELMDGKISGDFGVRYVKTTVEVQGASGVQFAFDPSNAARLMDPFKLAELRDTSLPECAPILFYGTDYNAETRWSRVDGLGYDTNATKDLRDDTALADQGACHDPNAVRGNPNESEWWLWRHSDVSTEKNYVYGERKFDDNGNLLPTEDRSLRSFSVTDEHDYDLFLPSLNINYLYDEDTIIRFAASKTMARPQIDSLRPGFKVRETQWGGENRNNTITLTNPKLDPLESINLDISYEWYFNESGLLAATLFYKDMTNFEESETIVTYMDDLRGIGLTEGETYDPNDLVLISGQDSLEGCMPRRFQGSTDYQEEWLYSDDLEQLCAKFNTTRIKNGKGASIKGLELQYMQTYDNLPGIWSGLGLQANYTYQDSEYDQEVSSIDSNVKLPSLAVAYTPEHSYNLTGFWEKDGHQLRLSYQGTTDQLVQRSWENGSLWEEGRQTLDFSASYKVNDKMTVSLQVANLTDEGVRQYFTSRFLSAGGQTFSEGSPLEGEATKSRTVYQYHTGRTLRLNARINF